MRRVGLLLTLWLLGACGRASCGPGGPCNARETAGLRTSAPSASVPLDPAKSIATKDVQVLEQIKARRGGASVRYATPEPAELESFRVWFRGLISASESNAPPPAALVQAFELDASAAPLWLAGEQAGARRGAGVFVLRAGTATPWLIEAPHTFFDVGTLEIAETCFEVLGARALLVNTVRRTSSADEDMDPSERAETARAAGADSDLAHAPQSFFATAHSALLSSTSGYATLQLHGFRDELVPGVAAIVSAAGTNANVDVVARQLRALLGDDAVRLYPKEVKQLGGTRNVQARLSQASGAPFIHLELSKTLRDRLKTDPPYRYTFAGALKTAALAMASR